MSEQLSTALSRLTAGDAAGAAAILESLPAPRSLEREPMHMLALARAHLGRFDSALGLYRRLTADDPANPDVCLQFGTCLVAAQHTAEALAVLSRVRWLAIRRPDVYVRLGATYFELGDVDRAGRTMRAATAIAPAVAEAWTIFAHQTYWRRDPARAIACYRRAAAIELSAAILEPLAMVLVEQGGSTAAADYLDLAVSRIRASAWHHPEFAAIAGPPTGLDTFSISTTAKLEHDAEQLDYLVARGRLPSGLAAIAKEYREIAAETRDPLRTEPCFALAPSQQRRLADTYNRILYRSPAGRRTDPPLNQAAFDRRECERRYAAQRIVVDDDFLTPEALAAAYDYCVELTIWFDDRHLGGYLGSFLKDGLACPLLLAIVAALPRALPGIFAGHELKQMWAFKYETHLQGIALHADAAAVNVNFWVTPDRANLMPGRGGLVIFDKAAPSEWDFRKYNNDQAAIVEFLERSAASAVTVPYKQNRCVIFDSDLFHRTDEFRFQDDYANRRVNITILYGDRPSAAARRPR